MVQRESSILRFLLALLLLIGAEAKRLAFHLNADGAYCKSGTFDVQLNLVKFLCSTGTDICRPSDSVIVEGHIEVGNFLPVDVTQKIKVCKYWGTLCSPVLDYATDTIENDWHLYSMYGNSTAPNKGFYGFERRFTWPDNTMTSYPWAGFSFNLIADIQADDSGNGYTPHIRCFAPFTTVDLDAYNEDGSTGSGFSYNFGKWGMVGVVGVGAYAGFMQRKRRLQAATPSINLRDDDPQVGCTNFKRMDHSATGGDDSSVRV